jgi:Ca2+-binding RTX toxin-like protein
MAAPRDRRFHAPRFETLEPRLLLSADLPILPMVDPGDLGLFLYERSLLSESLLQEKGGASVVDRIRAAGAAGAGVSLVDSAGAAEGRTAPERSSDPTRIGGPAASGEALRDPSSGTMSPSYAAAEATARYGAESFHQSSAQADLAIEQVSLPEIGEAGERVTVSWSVTNTGNAATPQSGWHDAVYFSRDATLDRDDLRLASLYAGHREALSPGESLERSVEIDLPTHASEGYLFVAIDRFGHVAELSEANNVAMSHLRLDGLERPDPVELPVAASSRGAGGDIATIAAAQQQALSDGLATLTQWAERISGFGEFAQDLPLLTLGEDALGEAIGVTLGDVFGEAGGFAGLGASIYTNLVEPLGTLFDGGELSSDDVVAALQGLGAVAPGSVSGGVFDFGGEDELRFDLMFMDSSTLADIPIVVGEEAADIGLSVDADATLDLSAGVMFDLSFGVVLDDSLAAGDAFFIRSDGLTVTGGFAGAGSLSFGASIGFLDVAVEGGSASLEISALGTLLNPDGDAGNRVTGSELAGSSAADLISIAPGAAPYSLTLPVSAEIQGLAGLSTTIVLSGDAFSGMAPAVALDGSFDDFGSFTNIDALNFAGLVDQLATWFGDVSASDLFGTEIPFTGATVGEILNFSVPFESLVDAIVSPETGEASFDSIQTLEAVLSQVLGGSGDGSTPGIANLAFDSATSELTFALRIEAGTTDSADFMIDPISEELSFAYELPAGLGGISTAATLSIGASAVFMLTMGVRLERLGAGVPQLTESSRLDEIFRAIGDDVVGIRTIAGPDIRVETRDGGSFEADLNSTMTIGDVLDALTRDGVTAEIAEDGYSLVLTDSTEGDARFKIGPAQANAFAATDLGINLQDLEDDGVINGTALHGDTLLERFFIRDTGAEANVSFSADDLSAQARFGFVELELGGATDPGSASVDLGVEFAVEDTTRGDDGVFLSELFAAFAENDLGRFVQTPVFTGVATAVLPVTGSLGGALGAISGSPRIEVEFDLTDIATPGEISAPDISLEGFDDLLDFRDLSIDDVLGALTGAVDFLTMFEQFDFLDTDLPLIGRSVSDVLAFAAEFNGFVQEFTSTDAGAENPTLLTNLEERLDEALAAIPFATADSVIEIDRSGADAALRFGLTFGDEISEMFALNLDIVELLGSVVSLPPQVGNLLSVGGSGELLVTAGYEFTLDLGLDLGTLTPFVYGSTGLTASFLLAADDIDVEVAIGPLGAEIINGSASISQDGSGDPVIFEYGVVGGDADRVALSALGFSDLSLESAPAPGVSVNLPLSLPLIGAVGPITLEIDNFASSSPTITGSFPDITDAFSNLDLVGQLNVLVDGLDLALMGISNVLSGEILGVNIPLVGDNLSGAATFIEDFRASTVGALADALDDDPSGALAFDLVADVLNDVLGPSNLNFLRDVDGDGAADEVEVLFNGVDPMSNMDPVDEITFVVPLGTTFGFGDIPPVAFDLGFPGLSLDIDADIDLMLEFGWDLVFGVDRDNGFFFDVSATPTALAPLEQAAPTAAPGASPEEGPQSGPAMDARSAELFLEFSAEAATLDAEGTLAILRVLASDLGDGTPAVTLSALFGLDITDPNGDGKLTFQELATLGPGFDPVIEISGSADLDLTADFGGLSEDIAEIFPSISTALGFTATLDALGADFGISRLEFNDISIDAGALFTDFIFPIISQIEEALDPFDPIVETLTSPVPVISDLRGDDVSLVDLAVEIGSSIGLNLGWLNAVVDIFELVEFVGNLNPSDIEGGIPFGSIDLTPALTTRGMDVDFSQLDLNDYVVNQGNGTVMDAEAAAMSGDLGPTLMRTGGIRGGGFEFPLLSDPLSAFGLLLGQDADLFRYNMAPLIFQFNFSAFFSVVGPIGVRLSGSLGAEVNLGFGYDTSGIRKAVDLIDAGGNVGQIAFAVIDGFFLIDKVDDGTGNLVERVEARIFGSISAAVELNIVVAAAGVEGGIEATFNADLNDLNDDGKVRLSEVIEIVEQTNNFACLFEFSGQIDAFLDAYARVGFPPLGKRWDFELARVTLLSFSFDCELNDPVLASQSGDVLLLHMGPNAGLREFGDTSDTAENFRVSQIAPGVMQVRAFDLTQNYGSAANPIREIRGEGGFLDDVINIDPSVTADTRLFGGFESDPFAGSGDDQLFGGSGDNYIDGGDGDDSIRGGDNSSATDTLIGGEGVDTIIGRRGPDMIFGGGGNDLLFGDQGDDVIDAGAGDDEVYGGTGDDTLLGRAGVDALFGETGDDVIDAGTGDDAIFGGLGSDSIIGGEGRDTIDGLDIARGVNTDDMRRDIIYGGDGVDFISATGGASLSQGNIVVGGLGADFITTGDGADLIFGDRATMADAALGDVDTIDSGGGNDEIRGGAGADIINAGAGDDVIFGALVFETADGAGEGDRIDAGAGDDLVFGSSLDDVVFGGAGADRLLGGGGRDEIRGQDGDDIILGGFGDDALFGDAGDDQVFGEQGVDILRGGSGNDTLVAGTGLGDQLFGGFGDDLIFGSDDSTPGGRGGAMGDFVDGGAGMDRIFTFGGDDQIFGGAGDDYIISGAGADFIDAGAGDDFAFAGTGDGNQIFGREGMDTLYGSDEGSDFIDGGDDDDLIFGQGGADEILGAGGNDVIDGGIGEDLIRGGDGDDVIVGGGWSDEIYGDDGNDDITGSADGDDLIFGGLGDDVIRALGSNDRVEAGAGDDWVDGGSGDDLIFGDAGNDVIAGGADHDVIYGYRALATDDDGGNDIIFGDGMDGAERGTDGRDRIYGGAGTDEMFGQGDDDFIDPGPGESEVIDYGSGERPIPEDFIQPLPTPSVPFESAIGETFAEDAVPETPVVTPPALPEIPEIDLPERSTIEVRSILVDLAQSQSLTRA